DRDRDPGQLHVLDESRLEDVSPVSGHPVPAERPVVRDAAVLPARRPAEVRDHRPAPEQTREPVHVGEGSESRRLTWPIERTPATSPASSTTTSCSAPSVSISDSASRSVVCTLVRGPSSAPFGASSWIWDRR